MAITVDVSNELQCIGILVATDETQSISKLYITSQKGFEFIDQTLMDLK